MVGHDLTAGRDGERAAGHGSVVLALALLQ
jgi:hypothetical protein